MKGVLIFKVPPAEQLYSPTGLPVHSAQACNHAIINLLPLDLMDLCKVIILVDEYCYYVYKNNITNVTNMQGTQTKFLPNFIEELENAS